MYFVSIFERQTNLAQALIEKGLATAIRHRADDERSPDYDALLEAELDAEDKKVGIHSGKSPSTIRYNDLVGPQNSQRAKAMEGSLTRMGKVDGTVEYVFSGARYKIRIEREQLMIPFVLAGIRVPSTARLIPNTTKVKEGEPFGAEALALTRETILNHEVQVQVHQCDRGGNSLGSLWYKVDGKWQSFAELLVSQGLAQTVEFSLNQMPYANQLLKAEEAAKRAKLNLWTLDQELPTDTGASAARTIPAVEVCHANAIDDFYVQTTGDANFKKVQSEIASVSNKKPEANELRRNACVLAEYYGSYYRAKIVEKMATRVKVQFVDYGNIDTVEIAKLKVCPQALSDKSVPSCAMHCTLAGIKKAEDFTKEGMKCMEYFTGGQKLSVQTEGFDMEKRTRAVLTLSSGKTVQEELVAEGLARVDPKSRSNCIEACKKAQEKARKQRVHMWQYGDSYADDEDNNYY
jgi:staphylococcal nuclease domain-containing protein 1